MNFKIVMQLIGRWGGTIKFFPSDPEARIGIAEEIVSMAENEDQVRWLVARLPKLYTEWPAMHEVRATFCSKFKPKDGDEVYSEIYLEGIPAESTNSFTTQIAATTPLQISGDVQEFTSVDPERTALVLKVSEARTARLPRVDVDTSIKRGESELSALTRSVSEYRERTSPVSGVRVASKEEIEAVKRQQEANRSAAKSV